MTTLRETFIVSAIVAFLWAAHAAILTVDGRAPTMDYVWLLMAVMLGFAGGACAVQLLQKARSYYRVWKYQRRMARFEEARHG